MPDTTPEPGGQGKTQLLALKSSKAVPVELSSSKPGIQQLPTCQMAPPQCYDDSCHQHPGGPDTVTVLL